MKTHDVVRVPKSTFPKCVIVLEIIIQRLAKEVLRTEIASAALG